METHCLATKQRADWRNGYLKVLSQLPGVKPVSDARLDRSTLKEYEDATRRMRGSYGTPGCCFIVIFRNSLVHAEAYGKADLESGAQMRLNAMMRLYCMTKPMVVTALMILVEQGQCRLEDELSKYLPAFGHICVGTKKKNRVAKRKLTLRKLLTHTSGLGYGPMLAAGDDFEKINFGSLVADIDSGCIQSLQEFCDALALLPLRFEPGKKYQYSYGVDVIGRVIEVITGTTLDMFLKDVLFTPLGMKDTTFAVSRSLANQGRLAALYSTRSGRRSMGEAPSENEIYLNSPWGKLVRMDGSTARDSAWVGCQSCPVLSGGGVIGSNWGGLVSTILDQAKFCLMLARHGHLGAGYKRILKKSTVEAMTGHDWLRTRVAAGRIQRDAGQPFGWNALCELGISKTASTRDPEAFEMGEWGMAGGACTHWSVNPSRKLICLWFSQNLATWPGWEGEAQDLWRAARLLASSASSVIKSSVVNTSLSTRVSVPKKRSATSNETKAFKCRKAF